jgi:periplasmic protein TonB
MDGAARGTAQGAVSRAPIQAGVRFARRADPLAVMIGPGDRWEPFYLAGGVAVALHAAMLASAIATGLLRDLRAAVDEDRARLHDYFWREYEVEVAQKPTPKAEEPPPPPDPPPPAAAPMIKAPSKVEDDPYKNVPAMPAQAAKVLVQDDPDKVQDLTGNTIVTGDGTATYGQLSAAGKGDNPTMARNASLNGAPGAHGTGSARPPPPPPGPDLSRSLALAGGTSWNCPFPPEADADQVDQAVVRVQVTVRADGSAASVSVLSDPGHGFGRAARLCALQKRYQPALDHDGNAMVASSPVTVRFNR